MVMNTHSHIHWCLFLPTGRFSWIAFGALYYTIHDEYDYYVALYKAVSIGWSIGWDMPYETHVSDDAASMTYSCFHNCMVSVVTTMTSFRFIPFPNWILLFYSPPRSIFSLCNIYTL